MIIMMNMTMMMRITSKLTTTRTLRLETTDYNVTKIKLNIDNVPSKTSCLTFNSDINQHTMN